MNKQYVISSPYGYVKQSEISCVDERFQVETVTFTPDLQKAEMFSQEEYEHDLESWESYFGVKEYRGFSFREAEQKVALK